MLKSYLKEGKSLVLDWQRKPFSSQAKNILKNQRRRASQVRLEGGEQDSSVKIGASS